MYAGVAYRRDNVEGPLPVEAGYGRDSQSREIGRLALPAPCRFDVTRDHGWSSQVHLSQGFDFAQGPIAGSFKNVSGVPGILQGAVACHESDTSKHNCEREKVGGFGQDRLSNLSKGLSSEGQHSYSWRKNQGKKKEKEEQEKTFHVSVPRACLDLSDHSKAKKPSPALKGAALDTDPHSGPETSFVKYTLELCVNGRRYTAGRYHDQLRRFVEKLKKKGACAAVLHQFPSETDVMVPVSVRRSNGEVEKGVRLKGNEVELGRYSLGTGGCDTSLDYRRGVMEVYLRELLSNTELQTHQDVQSFLWEPLSPRGSLSTVLEEAESCCDE
ncbi:unnamed protein product [Chrysoparadoxa australica]